MFRIWVLYSCAVSAVWSKNLCSSSEVYIRPAQSANHRSFQRGVPIGCATKVYAMILIDVERPIQWQISQKEKLLLQHYRQLDAGQRAKNREYRHMETTVHEPFSVALRLFIVKGGAMEQKQGGRGERSCCLLSVMLDSWMLQSPALKGAMNGPLFSYFAFWLCSVCNVVLRSYSHAKFISKLTLCEKPLGVMWTDQGPVLLCIWFESSLSLGHWVASTFT